MYLLEKLFKLERHDKHNYTLSKRGIVKSKENGEREAYKFMGYYNKPISAIEAVYDSVQEDTFDAAPDLLTALNEMKEMKEDFIKKVISSMKELPVKRKSKKIKDE